MTNPDSAEAEFLAQAEEALEDAEILIEKERFAGSINRAYYAAFYSACALLDSVGLKSNSHQAAIALLYQDINTSNWYKIAAYFPLWGNKRLFFCRWRQENLHVI